MIIIGLSRIDRDPKYAKETQKVEQSDEGNSIISLLRGKASGI